MPTSEAVGQAAEDSVLAFQESQDDGRQAVLRRIHDVLNLSVALAQPATRPAAPRGALGWADHAALWARASQPGASALLGEGHVFMAIARREKGGVAATAELGQGLDPVLPYRDDRPRNWWRGGTTTTAGYALWDGGPAAATSPARELVLIGPADKADELSGWAWSDGTAAMPPFARYLMHAAKLRYEARLLDSWHSSTADGQDTDSLVAELSTILAPERPDRESARLLRSRQARLRAGEARLTLLDADLARLEQTVTLAQRNLLAQPGCGPSEAAGVFAADQSLARYLTGQVSSDRGYLQIELSRAKSMRELATEALGQPGELTAEPTAARTEPDIAKRVFVVYGRDGALARSFFDLLYAVGLQPLEWERLVKPTGTTTPYLGDVVRTAPHLAQANLVLLSPDDVVELHPDLYERNDHPYERGRSGQARPNVLFELGLAYMAYPERTIIVEVGHLRPVADLAGLNVIRFDGSATAVSKVISRLTMAGCPADTSGETWLDPSRFAALEAYRRGPESRKGGGAGCGYRHTRHDRVSCAG
jgi:predicted nucleotide-binding protein